jgi:hypothetical protein
MRFFIPLEIFQDALQSVSCTWLFADVYDYITKLCRQQAEIIQNHENEQVAVYNKVKPGIKKCRIYACIGRARV